MQYQSIVLILTCVVQCRCVGLVCSYFFTFVQTTEHVNYTIDTCSSHTMFYSVVFCNLFYSVTVTLSNQDNSCGKTLCQKRGN